MEQNEDEIVDDEATDADEEQKERIKQKSSDYQSLLESMGYKVIMILGEGGYGCVY